MILRLQFHATGCFHHRCRHVKSLLSIALQCSFRHLDEGLLDARALNGTSLIEEHVVVVTCPLLAAFFRNLPLRLLVQLVADANERESLRVVGARIFMESIAPARE